MCALSLCFTTLECHHPIYQNIWGFAVSFLPAMAWCTIRASLKSLIIFIFFYCDQVLPPTNHWIFCLSTQISVIPCCSFHWESPLWHSWEVTNFLSMKLFLILLFFWLIFKCVLRGKKWQFLSFPTIVGSSVTVARSLNSGVKLNFWWLCQLLCLGLDYFPLFSGD